MVIQTHQLTPTELAAVDALCADCKAIDGHAIPIYKHLLSQYRATPCHLLYNPRNALQGFFNAFFFQNGFAEIALMIAPNVRRKGIATELMRTVMPWLRTQDIHTLVFSAPAGLTWPTTHGLRYKSSEYRMQRLDRSCLSVEKKPFVIRLATEKDIPVLCAIDNVCFSGESNDMTTRFLTLLNDPAYRLFVISKEDGPIVGKANLHQQEENIHLSDIAVIPSMQRCGMGSALLTHSVNYALALQHPIITLDVETHNTKALSLYTRLGFNIQNACDYWSIPVHAMNLA